MKTRSIMGVFSFTTKDILLLRSGQDPSAKKKKEKVIIKKKASYLKLSFIPTWVPLNPSRS
jgi:hypothetical protein